MRNIAIAGCLLLLAFQGARAGRAESQAALPSAASATVEQHIRKGLAALESSRLPEAESEFSAALRVKPHLPQIRADLGLAYYADHKYPQAIKSFQQALQENASLETAKAFLLLSFAAAGRCRDAEPGLQSQFASTADARLRRVTGLSLVRCLSADAKLSAADQVAQKLLADYPNDPDVLYEAGRFYGNLSSSLDARLMHVDPHSARTYQVMASVARSNGNWRRAISAYGKALKVNPSLEGAHLQIAVLLLTHSPDPNAWREALTELNEELKVNPSSAEAEYEIGEVYRKHDQPPAAIAAFRRSLQYDPGAVPTRVGLAKALQQHGERQQALDALLPAEHSAPNDPTVHFLLAQLYRELGRSGHAAQEQAAFERLQQSTAAPNGVRQGKVR
ncbi:MAG: tetratricopeptide repeat protein [Terriglobia bacterium]